MNSIKKYIKQFTWLHVLQFLGKILIVVACRYLIEESPADIFKKKIVTQLLEGISFFFLINIIISVLALFIKGIYLANKRRARQYHNNFVLGISRIATMLNVVVFVIAIMIGFSINPLQFITSISIVAAAIALLSKDYITNLINGLILMFSDRLELGDYIVIDKTKGKIIDITFLNVILLDDEGDFYMIPNTTIFSNVVINQSHEFYKKSYIDFNIDNQLGIDFDSIQEELSNVLTSFEKYVVRGSIILKPKEIDFQFVKYRFIFNIKNEHIDKERTIKSELLRKLISFNKTNKKEN